MKNNPQWWDFTTPNDEIWFYNPPLRYLQILQTKQPLAISTCAGHASKLAPLGPSAAPVLNRFRRSLDFRNDQLSMLIISMDI